MCVRRLRALLRKDDGSATVEFALWLPLFFMIFCSATDAALLMHKQTQMIDLARATSRAVSLGISTPEEAETMARERLESEGSVVAVSNEAGFVTSRFEVPFQDVLMFTYLFAAEGKLRASITMANEAVADPEGAGA